MHRFSAATGHYSQVIWASTNRVGCGFTQYKDGSSQTNLYVCNYGPAGNFISSAAYRSGSPCSQCPTGTACSAVYANLCGKLVSLTNSRLPLIARQTFNSDTCTCSQMRVANRLRRTAEETNDWTRGQRDRAAREQAGHLAVARCITNHRYPGTFTRNEPSKAHTNEACPYKANSDLSHSGN